MSFRVRSADVHSTCGGMVPFKTCDGDVHVYGNVLEERSPFTNTDTLLNMECQSRTEALAMAKKIHAIYPQEYIALEAC